MSKQFFDVAKISTGTAQEPRVKMDFKVTSSLTEFNTLLRDLNSQEIGYFYYIRYRR